MAKAIGLVTCNYTTASKDDVFSGRPVASMPYLGRYRLVDFALSNMVNAGIRNVGMIMPNNYRSLVDHVGSGKDWDLDRKNGGLFIMPGTAFGTSRTGARFLIRDLVQNRAFLTKNSEKYVVLSTANFICSVDVKALIAKHEETGANITVLTKKATCDGNIDVVTFDLDGDRVTSMHQGVKFGEAAFLDYAVIERTLLLELIDSFAAVDHLDLFEALNSEYGRFRVIAAEFDGYMKPIFDKPSYFKANMDLLDPEVLSELTDARPIKTKAHDNPPAKYEPGAKVSNSLIASGDRIYGSVQSSVLGRNVIVEPGASVRNSVVMQGVIIKKGAKIENAIIDKANVVPAGTELRGTDGDILYLKKN
ncbi:MAG: glucose-1-phosphate adenylyltransferase subunit GlgD [Coriobacteriales bacterium]|nr:glucose-1-phosphate adenylyltransferase subunit GlgD [Coriobacteriales bacterium]